MAPEIASSGPGSQKGYPSRQLWVQEHLKLQSYNSFFGQNYVNFSILMHEKLVFCTKISKNSVPGEGDAPLGVNIYKRSPSTPCTAVYIGR